MRLDLAALDPAAVLCFPLQSFLELMVLALQVIVDSAQFLILMPELFNTLDIVRQWLVAFVGEVDACIWNAWPESLLLKEIDLLEGFLKS